jgi:hypothetical protein
MNELINEYFEIQKEISELEFKKEALKNKIKLQMIQEGIDKFEDSVGNLVTYKEMVTNRFNKAKALGIIGADKLSECYSESSTKSLRIYNKDQRMKYGDEK